MRPTLRLLPIGDHFDAASEDEVLAAESAIRMSLPPTLRELQLKHGRCTFDGEATIRSYSGHILNVFTLFGCKGKVGNFITDFYAHPEFVARALLPIGDDMFNNRFVWSSHSRNVDFIDYSRQGSAITVAASLDEFFQKIIVVPDE